MVRRGGKCKERRTAPRVPYKAHAAVFYDNQSYTCHIVNLSRNGALLTAPTEAHQGAFVRLNLKLPGLDSLIDLDAIMVRQSEDQRPVWAVNFCNVSARARAQLEQYIGGILKKHAEEQEQKVRQRADARKRSNTGSRSQSGDWQDWKSLQSAMRERLKQATEKVVPARKVRSEPTTEPPRCAAARGPNHMDEELEQSFGSLDDIYRDALSAMADSHRKTRKR